MADDNFHCMCVAAVGQAAIGELLIGQIVLPADGPWIVHGTFCQAVSATATAAETLSGYFKIEAAAGDLNPNPAPARFPFAESGASLGATIDQTVVPLKIFPVMWNAPGRAAINLILNHTIAVTVPPQIVAGLLFCRQLPEIKSAPFCDTVRVATNSAAATAIGTMTLAEKATKITGICAMVHQGGVLTAGEEITGFVFAQSDDINVVPLQIPFNAVYGAGLGALINHASAPAPQFIPVDIPVQGGARINWLVDLNTALTNTADIEVFVMYE